MNEHYITHEREYCLHLIAASPRRNLINVTSTNKSSAVRPLVLSYRFLLPFLFFFFPLFFFFFFTLLLLLLPPPD